MKLHYKIATLACALLPFYAFAGGNPDHVKLPGNYQQIFTQYDKSNRANQTQVAKFFANEIAVDSYKRGEEAAPGSIVVMEIYEPRKDAEEKIITATATSFSISNIPVLAAMIFPSASFLGS